MINKCKLIDLFYAGRKSERGRMKNPAVSSFVFVVSVVMLGVAYRNVLVRYAVPDFEKELVVYILMGSLGTFLFFWSVAGLLFQVVSANKSFYFKGKLPRRHQRRHPRKLLQRHRLKLRLRHRRKLPRKLPRKLRPKHPLKLLQKNRQKNPRRKNTRCLIP